MSSEAAFPTLTGAEIERIEAFGRREVVEADTFLFVEGQVDYDFILIIDGEVEVLARESGDVDPVVVAIHGAGRFLGELSLVTGQRTSLAGRTRVTSTVVRLAPGEFRQLMANDTDLSDLIFNAYLARRDILRSGVGATTLRIYGSRFSAQSLAIGRYVQRQRLPFQWFDLDREDIDGDAELAAHGAELADAPIVVTPSQVLKNPTTRQLADHLGLTHRAAEGEVLDVVIVGAGPAGLAAAVYGASEGLATLLVDSVGVGGQAGTSSRIENYVGFPMGISGSDLVERAAVQAQRLGARVSTPTKVVGLDGSGEHIAVSLDSGDTLNARSLVLSMGVRYRRLPVDDLERFEGAGVYYAATEMEANVCGANPVTVVGGGNSAGQAAIFMAQQGSQVRIVIRGTDLGSKMSSYLVTRIDAAPNIEVATETHVVGLEGDVHLEHIELQGPDGTIRREVCVGLFSFIGAQPSTEWLPDGVQLDEKGFVLTDRNVEVDGEPPLPFETSMSGVFAAGDIRIGSMKRVAAAVGEGSSVIRSVHDHLGREPVTDAR